MTIEVFEKIFDKFKEHNVSVYPVGMHKGKCKSNYVVIKDSGSNKVLGKSSVQDIIDILIYVPIDKPVELLKFKAECRKIIKELSPLVLPTGYEQQTYEDEEKSAWMSTIQVRNNRKVYY